MIFIACHGRPFYLLVSSVGLKLRLGWATGFAAGVLLAPVCGWGQVALPGGAVGVAGALGAFQREKQAIIATPGLTAIPSSLQVK